MTILLRVLCFHVWVCYVSVCVLFLPSEYVYVKYVLEREREKIYMKKKPLVDDRAEILLLPLSDVQISKAYIDNVLHAWKYT